jgi:cytochrome c peroxidase
MYHKINTFWITLLILVLSSLLFSQSSLTPLERLGKNIYFDKISSPDRMACATCHAPDAGFTGPNTSINANSAVYPGAVPQRYGNRKPPSASYLTSTPIFNYDVDDAAFFGGAFWDGRATGWNLGNPAAEQAIGPFLNPLEHNNANKAAVLAQIGKSKYSGLWQVVFGEPLNYTDPALIDLNYNRVGHAIAAYEASQEVNAFTSKYDFVQAGRAQFTAQEAWGLTLFNGKANCFSCHPAPLFTDFTYDNLGIPKNPRNPFYDMDGVFIDGVPINPLGTAWIDPGLYGFLITLTQSDGWRTLSNVPIEMAALSSADLLTLADASYGKHKVPSLRNVDKRPFKNFIKAYGHNGFFLSLSQIVHFYNTRDVITWAPPEVPQNVNTLELGNLGLTPDEEAAVEAFLGTLSDGYVPRLAKDTVLPEITQTTFDITGANPFNPNTEFSFAVAQEQLVIIDVYNLLGQKVAGLVNTVYPAGTYRVGFSGQDLPSGVYLAVFLSEQERLVKKITLLK